MYMVFLYVTTYQHKNTAHIIYPRQQRDQESKLEPRFGI